MDNYFVWSVAGGCGVTTVAAAIASERAHRGEITGVVDGARQPAMAQTLGIPSLDTDGWHPVAGNLWASRHLAPFPGERLDTVVWDGHARAERMVGWDICVIRNDYRCLSRFLKVVQADQMPDVVVVVTEPGAALGITDVVDVIGVPCIEFTYDPGVRRSSDAGLLVTRQPKSLERMLDLLFAHLAEVEPRGPEPEVDPYDVGWDEAKERYYEAKYGVEL